MIDRMNPPTDRFSQFTEQERKLISDALNCLPNEWNLPPEEGEICSKLFIEAQPPLDTTKRG